MSKTRVSKILVLTLALFYIFFPLLYFLYDFIRNGFDWLNVVKFVVIVFFVLGASFRILKPGIFIDYVHTFGFPKKSIFSDRSNTLLNIQPSRFSPPSSFDSEKDSPGCTIFIGWLMLFMPLLFYIMYLIFA